MIVEAECLQGEGLSVSRNGGSTQMAVIIRQSINELESPSFSYVPLFGQETAFNVRIVLTAAARAKAVLRCSEPEESKGRQSIWSRISEWFMYSVPAYPDENGEDVNKTLNHLDMASTQLAALFDVMKADPFLFAR